MLSRIAESLFWIGRYVERAEDTARILDVHYHLLLEDPWVDEDAGLPGAARGDGRRPDAPTRAIDAAGVLELLAVRPTNPRLDRRLARRGPGERPRRPRGDLVGDVGVPQHHPRTRCRPGRAASRPGRRTTSSAGCSERAAIARRPRRRHAEPRRRLALPRARPQPRARRHDRPPAARPATARPAGRPAGSTTLRCCSALRGVPAHLPPRRSTRRSAAEFLLLDRLFPRSVFHALDHRRAVPGRARPASGRAGVDDEARRLLGRVRTELEFRRARRAARRPARRSWPGCRRRAPRRARGDRPAATSTSTARSSGAA